MNYSSMWVSSPRTLTQKHHILSSPEPGEVVVKVEACGICGTDLHFYQDYPEGKPMPLGHEVAGIIYEVGEGIQDLEMGMPVVVQNHIACGACDSCLNQQPDACSDIQTYMNGQAGIGEFLTVPKGMVIPYIGLTPSEASLAEPVTVSLDLCREADVQLHDDVLILGPGVIGLSCIPILRDRGAKKIVVVGRALESARGSYRKEVALKMGADEVVDSTEASWKDMLKKKFSQGFQRVIVTSPPSSIPDGIEMAGFRGTIVYNGISFTHDEITFSANDFHFKKKRLLASHAIPNWGFPTALRLIMENRIPADLLITHLFPMEDLDAALELFKSSSERVIKPVIIIDN